MLMWYVACSSPSTKLPVYICIVPLVVTCAWVQCFWQLQLLQHYS